MVTDDDDDDRSSTTSTTAESDYGDASEDENWMFKTFFEEIDSDVDGTENLSLKQYQELFRERYADFLVGHHHLRRNSIHKIKWTLLEIL